MKNHAGKYLQQATATTAGVLAALSTSAAWAQAQPQSRTQQAPSIRPAPATSPGEGAGEARNPFIAWGPESRGLRGVLESVSHVCPQKFLIASDITDEAKVSLGLTRPTPLFEFLDLLCQSAGLSWGRLDADTIVVMRAHRTTPGVPLPGSNAPRTPRRDPFELRPFLAPFGTEPHRIQPRAPFIPSQPLPPRLPMTGLQPPSPIPKGSRPFNFNGGRYYAVPLAPAFNTDH